MKFKLLFVTFFCLLLKQIKADQQCGNYYFTQLNELVFNVLIFVTDCGHGSDFSRTHSPPWVALIKLTEETFFGSTFCAGTLVDNQHVVTAAYCLRSPGLNKNNFYNSDKIEVFFNKTKRKYYHEARYAHLIKIGYDFAILKLSEPVQYAKPICIPEIDSNKYYKLSTFGWGSVGALGKHYDIAERQVNRLSRESI